MNSSIINIGVYQILLNRLIGQGWHSTTYQCINIQQMQKQLVAKIYQSQTVPNDAEIIKLKKLNHANVVQIYDVYQNEKDVIIIMEKCQSSLRNEMKFQKEYDEMELLAVLSQILKGYNYILDQGLEINELKPTNIMIDDNEIIKVSNYGMSNLYKHSDVEVRPYAAPEIFFSNKQTDAKNIYSLGLIIYQLVFHQLPFSLKQNGDVIAFLQRIKKSKLQIPQNKFQKITEIISQMIIYDYQERINREKLGELLIQNFKRGTNCCKG
ncbi:unnamed protein product (macronuclear) [Paramecium tetraurelia]|uniref:Protein kinase domain-containing protein n=1 Tax=Paramecium tetraurelia TaxID=5888 RepID=A0BVP0_PARTE|nr:uncharacterized protein GSPATT00032459001 [Paramecium tetraurelia]CAK62607.1 unnamed protein product [Paramecium tetraurelia]|eukprot:XP_001430005.1 hypothetical protein (macronuclear) [Paramecium tetraurelia strain d4-2]